MQNYILLLKNSTSGAVFPSLFSGAENITSDPVFHPRTRFVLGSDLAKTPEFDSFRPFKQVHPSSDSIRIEPLNSALNLYSRREKAPLNVQVQSVLVVNSVQVQVRTEPKFDIFSRFEAIFQVSLRFRFSPY